MNRTPFKSKSLCCLATVLFSILVLFGSASAAVFTVNKIEDTNDGVCDNDCSLREAIAAANAAPSDDRIEFNSLFWSPRTINLVGDSLNINNNGTLQINSQFSVFVTISGSSSYRVFFINQGATVTLYNLTMTNGRGYGQNFLFGGGAIYNSAGANTELLYCIVSNSRAAAPDNLRNFGGGIYNAGTMSILRSRIENNQVSASPAPTTFSAGGGIYNASNATLKLQESSVTNNTIDGNGGGIYNDTNGSLTLINTTVSGNSATGSNGTGDGTGGGILNKSVVNVTHSTIAKNTASVAHGGVSTATASAFNSRTSIYADNTVGENGGDFHGTMISSGYNLIENTTDTVVTGGTNTDILNQDPRLRPLSTNGRSRFHLPEPTSPAIDKGRSFEFRSEQRDMSRPYDNPNRPNAQGGDGADIGAIELQSSEIPNQAPFDFDGDRKSDIGIYRPSNGSWWISISIGLAGGTFGTSTDIPVPADYTGDNIADLAYFRPSDATWSVKRSRVTSIYSFQFGAVGDIPAPGDFDGDGKVDPAVYRPSTGQWFIQRSSDNVVVDQYFGIAEDKPAVADYDGDGKADIAIFRPSTGAWWINRSSEGIIAIGFGDANDKIVQGDYTGDGKADLALWRESNGFWYILRSEDYSFYGFPFGTAGDKPVPGDYDGDGKIDAGIFRPSENVWYLLRSTQGMSIRQFGTSGDVALPNIFVR